MAPDDSPNSYEAVIARRHHPEVARRYQFDGPEPRHDARALEARLGVILPSDFKRFMADVGPFSGTVNTSPETFEELAEPAGQRVDIQGRHYMLKLSVAGEDSILRVAERERRASSPMPDRLIPFYVQDVHTAKRVIRQFYCFDYGRIDTGEPLVTSWWSWMSTGPREITHPYGFLGWLARKFCLDEDAAKPALTPPPDDWDNASAWDDYWRDIIEQRSVLQFHALQRCLPLWDDVGRLRRRGVHRLLLAGNGVSVEGHALAHMGFEVTALDVSPRACNFVRDFPVEPIHLAQFLQEFRAVHDDLFGGKVFEPDERRSLARVKREFRAGGSLVATCADMFTYTPMMPFDVMVANRSIQGFSSERVASLARRFYEWTAPGGLCIIETLNLCHGGCADALEEEFRRAGFVRATGAVAIKRRTADWLRGSLRSEKRVLFAHGSG
jgi:hypothetical protein